MNARQYFLVSGALFALVALLHLVRVLAGWGLVVGGWHAPVWASVLGILVPGFLAVSAARLGRRA